MRELVDSTMDRIIQECKTKRLFLGTVAREVIRKKHIASSLTDLEEENARLKAEVKRLEEADETRVKDISRLTVERDVALEILSDPQSYSFDTVRSAGQKSAALIEQLGESRAFWKRVSYGWSERAKAYKARLDEALKALEPFAEQADNPQWWNDSSIRREHLLAARRVLEGGK